MQSEGCGLEEYKNLKNAGVNRFLIRIETTDQKLYKKFHPNMDFNNRVECLKHLKDLCFEVGTGCLVGLPGQTLESLANDILFFKEIEADMIGIGPFIPNPETPLKDSEGGSFEMARKIIREEGIPVGISSGAVILTALRVAAKEENRNKLIVAILPSYTERYLSTALAEQEKQEASNLPISVVDEAYL